MAWFRVETGEDQSRRALVNVPSRLILRGRVVTMDEAATVIEDGVVAIEEDKIVYVGQGDQPLAPSFANGPVVETGGTIYPGLFELHNHPAYNAIPLWSISTRFPDRRVWRGAADYRRHVSSPAALLTHDPTSENAKAVVRFVECRALLGGVTTTQGLSLGTTASATVEQYRGLVRNTELPDNPAWPTAVDQINDFESQAEAAKKYGTILNDSSHPFLMHVSEGTDDAALRAFDYLKRPDGCWLVGRNFIGIHCTALDKSRIQAMRASGGLVWSPLSNFLLYGATTDISEFTNAGVPLALGSDWAPSGTKNLLGELKVAKAASKQLGAILSDLDLVRSVTSTPANMVGWANSLGSIGAGKTADLLIVDTLDGDPYANLISATEKDLVAVLIGGRPRAGRASILDPRTPGVERIHVASQDMVLDLTVSPTHPLANMTLAEATRTLSYSLEHLPEAASEFSEKHALFATAQPLFVHLDMDEGYAAELVAGSRPIGPGDVDPMELDPITSIDDSTFRQRIWANPNLPEWLRAAL
ncbi:amidohydrolase family protein [Paraburkholderia sp. RCC_158]|uniref:amidohydrolase family protein n=1 Tax=Paraburkholderia sp. RCC_158 TaxID=3239220 RepID=UPI0035248314